MADLSTPTVEQLRLVLARIASDAGTLADFAKSTAANAEGPVLEQGYHVVSALADRIGILADAACGEQIIGNPMDWCCGPNYRTMHREVTHG